MRNTRRYDKEFRINAVKHLKSSDKGLREVAESLGIPVSTLSGWVKEYEQHGEQSFPGSGKIKPCNEEYYRLKKELDDVKMERDVLKKAVAIFSKAKK
jgi:transposase-like protein